LSLVQEALAAARLSPKPVERSMLMFRSLSLGSAALMDLQRRADSVAWARQALQAIPASIELRPADQAEVAVLQLRVGNRAAAQQLISALAAIGYRHPSFLRDLRLARA
jgi:hypothetical protein